MAYASENRPISLSLLREYANATYRVARALVLAFTRRYFSDTPRPRISLEREAEAVRDSEDPNTPLEDTHALSRVLCASAPAFRPSVPSRPASTGALFIDRSSHSAAAEEAAEEAA